MFENEYKDEYVHLIQCDCHEYLRTLPDKSVALAIVDPPYGIKEDGERSIRAIPVKKWRNPVPRDWGKKTWDNEPPSKEYFNELFRVSKNQIIGGANHFIENMPVKNSSCWIFWDKKTTGDFADGELAWTSFKTAVRKFEWLWSGFKKQEFEERIHPTQKPVALYKYLLSKYASTGDRILDTHGGSMSIAIGCYDLGFNLTLCEKDGDYFYPGVERYKKHIAQGRLFEPGIIKYEQDEFNLIE
ncbi:MAG: DNA methyltransferase [Victivallaceae bacterium]|jgi:site-specific DNA-methyltransferase (adenine-specific)